jgi:uncharacterized protein (UPF0333 family)
MSQVKAWPLALVSSKLRDELLIAQVNNVTFCSFKMSATVGEQSSDRNIVIADNSVSAIWQICRLVGVWSIAV